MSMKDQITRNAILRHSADLERSLEQLVAEGVPIKELALQQTVEDVDDFTMRLATKIVRKSA